MEEETKEIATTMFETMEPTPQQDANVTIAEADVPADAENRWTKIGTKWQQWRNRISTLWSI